MLSRLGTIAKNQGADFVELRYMPTSKNKPAVAFLESLVSAEKDAYEDGWRYQIPVRIAADCRLDPHQAMLECKDISEAGAAQVTVAQDSTSLFSSRSKKDFLIDIATELTDPNSIHEIILSFGRVRPELKVPFVAPRSPIEKEIASFWSELLGLDEVGANDNFFELGGHSLLAMQVFSRIRASFSVELSPRLLVTKDFTVAVLSKEVLMEQVRQCDASELETILENLDVSSINELRETISVGEKK